MATADGVHSGVHHPRRFCDKTRNRLSLNSAGSRESASLLPAATISSSAKAHHVRPRSRIEAHASVSARLGGVSELL